MIISKGSPHTPREKEALDVPKGQLYNMENDFGETENLYLKRPKIIKKLLKQLKVHLRLLQIFRV